MFKPKITFRSITPLVGFTYWTKTDNGFSRGGNFSYSGVYDNTEFEIKIVQARQGEPNFDTIILGAEQLGSDFIGKLVFPDQHGPFENYYLIVDVTHEFSEDIQSAGNTRQQQQIGEAFIHALQLHVENGFYADNTYQYRPKNPTEYIIIPRGRGGSFCVQSNSRLSSIRSSQLIETFNRLLDKPSDTSHIKGVLEIALQSISIYPFSGNVKYAFLILMIAFESLFKRNSENSDLASKRLSKLVASSRNEQTTIHRKFTTTTTGFRYMRNALAHGDPSYNQNIINAVQELLPLLQIAVVKVLQLNEMDAPPESDYYTWIDTKCNDHFNTLPNT